MNFENLHVEQDGANLDFEIGDPEARLISEIVSYQARYRIDYKDIHVIRATLNPTEITGRILVISTRDIFEFKLSLG